MKRVRVVNYLLIYLIFTAVTAKLLTEQEDHFKDPIVDVQQTPLNEIGSSQSKSNQTISYRLQSSIFEEALQELCPFPGFKGKYCPGQMAPKSVNAKQSQSSTRPMPSGVGVSFDITTGDLKLPVIQLTYDYNATLWQMWFDPYSKITFVQAQETLVQQVSLSPDVKIFKDEFELANVWLDASERGQWLGGQYSSSKDVHELYEKYFGGQYQTSISQRTKMVQRLAFLHDNQKLNRPAQRAIESLPKELIEQTYKEFLDSWGTHISMDTYIGGMIEKQTIFKDCSYSSSFAGTLSEDEIQEALHNELHGEECSSYFVARRRVSIDHKLGGNPEAETNWEVTINENPALLKINRFLSWDNFVSDPQIKQNLKRAIQNRVELAKKRFLAEKIKIEEERRLKRQEPKPVISVVAQNNSKSKLEINTKQFQMQSFLECPSGLSFEQTRSKCRTGTISTSAGVFNYLARPLSVRYERDYYGRFRAVFLNGYFNFETGSEEFYGEWVEKGCSMAQHKFTTQMGDMFKSPPYNSLARIVCTDCVPEYVTDNKFACNCPAF